MRRRFAKGMVVALSCLSLATAAFGGTIRLAWSPVQGSLGYRIHYGQSSGAYTEVRDVGPVTEAEVPDLEDCVEYFVAVKAYNAGGESRGFSNEVSGWSRPALGVAAPVARQQGARFTLELRGANFQPGAVVEVDNPNVRLSASTVTGCDRILLATTVEPTVEGVRPAEIGTFAVRVTNPDGTYGTLADALEVVVNPARFDVNRSDDGTHGRLDGKDTVWLARLFGGHEGGDALYDPDFDLNGDGWVDGQDVAHVASNLGRCWSGSEWTAQACEGR